MTNHLLPVNTITATNDSSTGIDTIAVSVPLGFWANPFRISLADGGFVQLRYRTAWVEASLPTRRAGHNLHLLDAATAELEIAHMLSEARDRLDLVLPPLEQVVVSRIDVARDFRMEHRGAADHGSGREDAPALLYALAHRPARGRTKTELTVGRPERRIASLTVRTKRDWCVRMYDKGLQSGDPRAQGVMRLEGEFRKKVTAGSAWARRNGATIESVGDITDEKIKLWSAEAASRINLPTALAHPFETDETFVINEDDSTIGVMSARV